MIAIVSAALTAVALGVYRHFAEDRLPMLNKVLEALGALALLLVVFWTAMEVPWVLLAAFGLFVLLNLVGGLLSTSPRLDAEPAHPTVWAGPLAELSGMGWDHSGTWRLSIGGKLPELTILERSADGARLIAIGTAPQGGLVEIQSLFDDGRRYLVTLQKRSGTLRPPWMFKQHIPSEGVGGMIASHDAAKHYLQAMGASTCRFPYVDPLNGIRAEHRMLRRYFFRRWWLVAVQPLAVLLAPSRSRPLHEQADIERQVRRYADWLNRAQSDRAPTVL